MGNFSRNTFDAKKSYVGVRLQQGVPLVDADWNELNDAIRQEIYDGLDVVFHQGVAAGSTALQVATTTNDPTANDIVMQPGVALVRGRPVRVSQAIVYSAQAVRGGINPFPALTKSTGNRTDIAFLDVWEREVNSGEDTTLVNPAIGIETCVRLKRDAALRVAEGTTTLPAPPPGHDFLPLAILQRSVIGLGISGIHGVQDIRPVFNSSKVDRAGDTITGSLTIQHNLEVDGNVGIGSGVTGSRLTIDHNWNDMRTAPLVLVRHNGDSPISPALTLQNDGGGSITQQFLFGSNSSGNLGSTMEAGAIVADWHGLTIRSGGDGGLNLQCPNGVHVQGGTITWGDGDTRTETRDNASLQGNAGARSGFYQTKNPVNFPTIVLAPGQENWFHLLDVRHSNPANNFSMQFCCSFHNPTLFFRNLSDTINMGWRQVMVAEADGHLQLGASPATPVGGSPPSARLIVGASGFAHAAIFNGDIVVNGITKSGGTFRIDHPLDPDNRYLQHSFVESPDMKNVYDGVVTLLADGKAVVELPAYFEALNEHFRYQLTAIGAPAPGLYVAEEIKNNRFVIAGGPPGLKVSWQVTGSRKDAYARANPVIVDQPKPPGERGTRLFRER